MTDIYKADESTEHYTPPYLLEVAREVFRGGIELDPCTHRSNPTNALTYYTEGGLERDWCPRSVNCWLNMPYGRKIGRWEDKLARWLPLLPSRQALALIPARVGAAWYRRATERANVICEIDGRIRFYERTRAGKFRPEKNQARWGSVLLYTGPDVEHARKLLRDLGAVRLGARRPSQRARLVVPPDVRQALAPGLCGGCFLHADHCVDGGCCPKCTHGARLRVVR